MFNTKSFLHHYLVCLVNFELHNGWEGEDMFWDLATSSVYYSMFISAHKSLQTCFSNRTAVTLANRTHPFLCFKLLLHCSTYSLIPDSYIWRDSAFMSVNIVHASTVH